MKKLLLTSVAALLLATAKPILPHISCCFENFPTVPGGRRKSWRRRRARAGDISVIFLFSVVSWHIRILAPWCQISQSADFATIDLRGRLGRLNARPL